MKSLSWIIISFLLVGHSIRASAQLWKYLSKYDPKAALAFEKTLDKEACSISSRSAMFAGEKSTFKIRTYCIQSFDGASSKIAISEIHHGHVLMIVGPVDTITIVSGMCSNRILPNQ